MLVTAKSFHSKMLWEWRNDPVTKQMSKNTEKISWEEHCSWYKKVLLDNCRKIFIGEKSGIPIGVVRFDKCDNEEYFFEVSINISPASRRKGFGKQLLNKGISRLVKEVESCKFIRAVIKKDNDSCKKLFKSCGFILIKNELEINSYQLTL